jgi:hypothetical protein
MLLAGNVTGSVSDIALTYYNPAKLSDIEINGFAFNARAYQLNSLKIDPLIADGNPISRTTFTGVPSLVGGTFSLFDERFAYVYLSKLRINNNLSTSYEELNESILQQFPLAESLALRDALSNDIKEDWYGLSWATQINEDLSLGISAFGVYYKYRGVRSANKTFQYEPDRVTTDLLQYNFEQQSYGLNLKVGASYTIDNVEIGLNATLPYLQVFGSGKYGINLVSAGTIGGNDRYYDYNFRDLTSKRKLPFGVSAGAGIKLNKSRIHLNVDYMNALGEYERLEIPEVDLGTDLPSDIKFNEKRSAVVNIGVGGELFIKENFKVFFGISTDFDSLDEGDGFFDLSTENADEFSAGTDYYHLSGGVDWTLKWANLILGLTYSRGTNGIGINSEIGREEPFIEAPTSTDLVSQRLQLVLGLEIPFLDRGMKSLQETLNNN